MRKRYFGTIVFLVAAFLLWVIFLLYLPSGKQVKVAVKPGVSFGEVAQDLADKKVIVSPFFFTIYAKYNREDFKILPGEYFFREGMSFFEVRATLEEGPLRKVFKITIPEGFTIEEIAERLKKTPLDQEKFKNLATVQGQTFSSDFPFLGHNPLKSLEGYLFPKTYIFEENSSEKEFIERLLSQFQKETSSLDFTPPKGGVELNLHQIVTIASLIEEEAKVPEERPLISAVIYNRLQKGMPLEIDATVQYALPQRKLRLKAQDLKMNSPYNTYQNLGLPPGPIASPGFESLKEALNPAPVDYLYYVLTDPSSGRHSFTASYQEFLKLKRQTPKSF